MSLVLLRLSAKPWNVCSVARATLLVATRVLYHKWRANEHTRHTELAEMAALCAGPAVAERRMKLTADYEYKIDPMDKCRILVRPKGSLLGYNVYGTFNTPEQARRILAALSKHGFGKLTTSMTEDEDE